MKSDPATGFKSRKKLFRLSRKKKWIDGLIDSGIDIIQLGSFVNPKKVPQMADTEELFKHFNHQEYKKNNVILSGLVLNEKGVERAMNCRIEMFCMGVSASETHSWKNTCMSVSEAQQRIIAMAADVMKAGKLIQVSVQSAFGCGYEGKVPEEKVLTIVSKYLEAGIKNISLADTAGYANPGQVEKLFTEIFKLEPSVNCACHFHNTYGLGIANAYSALKTGVKYFESSFAGLGGCPFTAIASGNVCTEDIVYMFQRMGIKENINIQKIIDVSLDAEKFFNRLLPGVIHRTGVIGV